MRDETFGGEIGAAEITSRQARAADVDLAGDADRHRLAAIVENVHFGVRDRPADRYGRRIGRHRSHLVPGRERRRLGRAVDVHQPTRPAVAKSGFHAARVGRFPAEQHVAAAKDAGRGAGELIEKRGRDEHRRHRKFVERARRTRPGTASSDRKSRRARAPLSRAPQISNVDASKAGLAMCATTSPGPSCR